MLDQEPHHHHLQHVHHVQQHQPHHHQSFSALFVHAHLYTMVLMQLSGQMNNPVTAVPELIFLR